MTRAKGVIIQTASIAGFEGQIGQDAYGASKGGIIALTLIAARDLAAAGIRVVAIAPGTINTPAYGKAAEQIEAYWGPQVPHPKRMGRPDEYAKLAIAIAENDYLNGTVIRLDGALRFPPKLSCPHPLPMVVVRDPAPAAGGGCVTDHQSRQRVRFPGAPVPATGAVSGTPVPAAGV